MGGLFWPAGSSILICHLPKSANTAYGAAPMLNWLVEEKGIAPHIPVNDKSNREDGTFSRSDFRYDPTNDVYHCPRVRP